ncbi:thiazole tautomerase TenI [Bacillus shivajii]|uniref:thiazole tautomerase TenI n=1 Tax=Bacillus shivajii TaxID=1983719 RepID=UPI001CFB1C30|nr:thiazole tautomerase TenI [Bacillus shivajii]UCZ52346.1 thiazole tautomerase TenI [Bacillus shivajii]
MEIHVISNGKQPLDKFVQTAKTIEPYVDYFHLREKKRTASEVVEGVELLKSAGIPASKLVINDRVDVAAAMKTAGTQLAYHSLPIQAVKSTFPHLRIGKSVHSVTEACEAEKNGADYILYGHVFPSNSKPGLEPRGVEQLRDIVESVDIPVIAIGGINPDRVNVVREAGAKGIAVMSGVLEAQCPLTAIQAYVVD